ncbi:hypothetical protein ACJO2E_12170 [Marinobacter sp. M1N3S26]|uniref:hypothetical protein n=1 Tax=Marinobacter sp. M1N3S26 TaxID=3382299 RepID=UPI00387AF9DC
MYNRIDLSLSPSRVAGLAAAGPWLLLLLVTLVMAWSGLPWVAILSPLAGLGAVDRWRRCGSLGHRQAVVRLTVHGPQLFATLADQTGTEVHVLPDSRLSGQSLFLALRTVTGGQRLQAVLVPEASRGNSPTDALRRFRTWLRLMPEAPAPINAATVQPNPTQHPWPGGKTHDH